MRVCVVVPIRACPSLCIGEALACHGIVPLGRVQTVAIADTSFGTPETALIDAQQIFGISKGS